MATKVGVVGLGAMGGGIALTLRKAGFAVVGYDLLEDLMAELEAGGGRLASSPRDVADRSDTVILSLPSAEAFHAVATGQGSIVESGLDGLVVFDTSTLAVADKEAAAHRPRDLGISLLDCAVSGTRESVLGGRLVLYAIGDRAAYDEIVHVIEGFTQKHWYLVAFGNASRMKYVVNMLVCINNTAMAEALTLAIKMGLDTKQVYDLVSHSFGSSRVWKQRARMAVEGNYLSARGTYNISRKDAKIIGAEAAAALSPALLSSVALQMHYSCMAQGFGGIDTASLYEVYKLAAGLESTIYRD
ncbi:MAG: NAD(P)-dependent oxidoreductase [Alphaproteobacteria bacterium]|nr:NAD(P)-dependent oxidoreductase [Alphaproteobacteria bacterium]